MIPKEKAKELYTTYVDYTYGDFNCKQCATIVVDNILNEYKYYLSSAPTNDLGINYWEEVKQEIEKL